ncbi:MAG: DegT/DnrJ/EryC1/StrS family aminotransferase [Planctomycetes bacterium]|nr:DegT/DnrJ/EryC1/StrS family aminotransferase [Planctomycetota bacterium]
MTKGSGNADAGVPVPLLDVVGGNRPLREAILEAIAKVIDSGRFLHGPECRELERLVAQRCNVPFAVSCASGSDALLLAMMAMGIGTGDEVIVPSFTFFATASCVWRVGARPVFVDIDPATFNLDPHKIEAAITSATKAVIPVHLFGQCAAMDHINRLAWQYDMHVVEDAAQAIGASYRGRPAGSWGAVGCFSFYPTKNLGGMGDGGILTTADPAMAERLSLFAAHGMEPRYYHQVVGINSRLDSMQAAVLCVKMALLDQWNQARQRNANRYHELFAAAGLDERVKLPTAGPAQNHVWNQYTIRVPAGQRDAIRAHLAEAKIGTEIYYPVPLHLQHCFRPLGYKRGSLPETEAAADEVLSLPVHPELTETQQAAVVDRVTGYFTHRARVAA